MRPATPAEKRLLIRALRLYEEAQLPGAVRRCMHPQRYASGQLAIGVKVEMEHTTDPALALEIAMRHLCEREDYYALLEKLEQG